MDRPSYYPASPAGVPAGLTEATADYKWQIRLVVVSLGLFALVVFGLIASCTAFLVWSAHDLLFGNRQHVSIAVTVIQLVLSPPLFLLLVYILKALFRTGRSENHGSIEISAAEQPRLFDFIARLCVETGAPLPRRVFVNTAVNATAYWHSDSWWHLICVGDKQLHIGLALVHAVNLTEFKALLAHEFGHFSQKSVRIGAVVYVAFGVINDIVEGGDFLDRLIDDWCHAPWLLAWPAWVVTAILWPLRQLLIGLRLTLFFQHARLMRQMELQADLVAVSVTGSDAPIHMLLRGEFAAQCMKQTVTDLQTALDDRLGTTDLFHHLAAAGPYIRRRLNQPDMGVPPPLPSDPRAMTCVYETDDDEQTQRWSTHPSHCERERNAKSQYIRTEFDERSAWLLFDNVDQLRAEATRRFYAARLTAPTDVQYAEPQHVQAFIDDERAETCYDPRYRGLYDVRNLMLDDVAALADDARLRRAGIAQLMQAYANMWADAVCERGRLHNQRLAEQQRLRPAVTETLDAELELDRQWLAELDRAVFVTHFQMALHLGSELADDLSKRYIFHIELQEIWDELKSHETPVRDAMDYLQRHKSHRLAAAAFQSVLPVHRALRDALSRAEQMPLPVLRNMTAGQPLRAYLLEGEQLEAISKHDRAMSGKWIRVLAEQMREVRKKVDRVHFKSLGAILAAQERIAQECQERWSKLPAALPFA